MASLPAARWSTGQQTSYGDRRLDSPVNDWWRKISQGSRRRAAAGTHTAVKTGAELNHVLHGKLPGGLGKTLGRRLGSEDRRRGELGDGGPAAAAGTRAPAIVPLGLINKRLWELLGCTRKGSGTCGGEGVDWREVRTSGANGGTTVARGGCACTRGAAGAGL
jgi:hypothetical protein